MDDRPQAPAQQAPHSIWRRAGTAIASLTPPAVTGILSPVLAEITAGIEAAAPGSGRPDPAPALPGRGQPRRPLAQLKRVFCRVDVWTLIATIVIAGLAIAAYVAGPPSAKMCGVQAVPVPAAQSPHRPGPLAYSYPLRGGFGRNGGCRSAGNGCR